MLDSVTAVSANEVNVAWTNQSAHATGFIVERTVSGQDQWGTVATLGSSANSYPDILVDGGTAYDYKVIAVGAGGSSADSNILSTVTIPDAVTTLGVNSASTSQINLNWTAVTGAETYAIYRGPVAGTLVQIDSVSTNSYQDTNLGDGLVEGTAYSYEVIAVGAGTFRPRGC